MKNNKKMEKLQKLTQDEEGFLYLNKKVLVLDSLLCPVGKIKTLVLANPSSEISVHQTLNEMAERNFVFIPTGANAYVSSDFNPDTQHLRKSDLEKSEKFYSVYAIQFYQLPSICNSVLSSSY